MAGWLPTCGTPDHCRPSPGLRWGAPGAVGGMGLGPGGGGGGGAGKGKGSTAWNSGPTLGPFLVGKALRRTLGITRADLSGCSGGRLVSASISLICAISLPPGRGGSDRSRFVPRASEEDTVSWEDVGDWDGELVMYHRPCTEPSLGVQHAPVGALAVPCFAAGGPSASLASRFVLPALLCRSGGPETCPHAVDGGAGPGGETIVGPLTG